MSGFPCNSLQTNVVLESTLKDQKKEGTPEYTTAQHGMNTQILKTHKIEILHFLTWEK